MVFRKHQDPEPVRSQIDVPAPQEGVFLLPGAEPRWVNAWLAQLLQLQPGAFPPNGELWDDARRALFSSDRFQNGAINYTGVQTWPILFRNEKAWIYAPISQARALSPYRQGLLDATRFPEPGGWNEYGMHAEILWAKPQGNQGQLKKLADNEKWLRDPRTQTIIANTIEWIPAHPSGVPYNTVSWETQTAWLRSSFIWQGAEDADNEDNG
jgi:hypothetical protein